MASSLKEKVFILDVDGVMTSGEFIYSQKGKTYKIFGPDDHDALNILSDYIEILFITGDNAGYNITKKRIQDHMKYPLELVSTNFRLDWIKERYHLNNVIYMCDGIFDFNAFVPKLSWNRSPLTLRFGLYSSSPAADVIL